MTWVLSISTFLGGVAAVLYFLERAKNREQSLARLRRKARRRGYSDWIEVLPEKLLSILLDKEKLWEHRFLEEALAAEIDSSKRLKVDTRLGRPDETPVIRPPQEAIEWMSIQTEAFTRLLKLFERIAGQSLNEALGEPGEPGDPERLLDVARRLGDVYREALEWEIRSRNLQISDLHNDQPARDLIAIVSRMPRGVVDAIELLRDRLSVEIERVKMALDRGDEQIIMNISIKVDSGMSSDEQRRIPLLHEQIAEEAKKELLERL